jgi:hypothetical protein
MRKSGNIKKINKHGGVCLTSEQTRHISAKAKTKKTKEMKNGFSWLYSKRRTKVQLLLTSGKIQKKKWTGWIIAKKTALDEIKSAVGCRN